MDSTIQNFANAVLTAGGKWNEIRKIAHKAKTVMNWGAKEPIVEKFQKWTKRYNYITRIMYYVAIPF